MSLSTGVQKMMTSIKETEDKYLLCFLILVFMGYNAYNLNRTTDAQIQFYNALVNTTLGALINQVTGGGSSSRTKATASGPEGTTLKVEQTDPKG